MLVLLKEKEGKVVLVTVGCWRDSEAELIKISKEGWYLSSGKHKGEHRWMDTVLGSQVKQRSRVLNKLFLIKLIWERPREEILFKKIGEMESAKIGKGFPVTKSTSHSTNGRLKSPTTSNLSEGLSNSKMDFIARK